MPPATQAWASPAEEEGGAPSAEEELPAPPPDEDDEEEEVDGPPPVAQAWVREWVRESERENVRERRCSVYKEAPGFRLAPLESKRESERERDASACTRRRRDRVERASERAAADARRGDGAPQPAKASVLFLL